jgi:hypothetical protein
LTPLALRTRRALAAFLGRTAGTPDLDHLGLSGRRGDRFSRCRRGFSADKFNAR